MNKIYFIDSENVGDNWISLLSTTAPDDEILVFYTARSPHMNYKNLILLKQSPKEVTFIECCEGNNALDFQLCTDLGYRVRDLEDAEFIIVSNDTGFDAAVKYWTKRSKRVSRIPGKACATVALPKPTANAPAPVREPQPSADATAPAREPQHAVDTPASAREPQPVVDTPASAHEPQPVVDAPAQTREPQPVVDTLAPTHEPAAAISAPEPKHVPEAMDARAKEILFIIGKDNLQLLHLALQQIFGLKKGKTYYNAFKSDTAYSNYTSKHNPESTKEKQKTYCSIVFELSEENLEMPNDFPKFAIDTWKNKKNLNSFKSALQSKYGKELSDKYYSMFKTHIKILDKIK